MAQSRFSCKTLLKKKHGSRIITLRRNHLLTTINIQETQKKSTKVPPPFFVFTTLKYNCVNGFKSRSNQIKINLVVPSVGRTLVKAKKMSIKNGTEMQSVSVSLFFWRLRAAVVLSKRAMGMAGYALSHGGRVSRLSLTTRRGGADWVDGKPADKLAGDQSPSPAVEPWFQLWGVPAVLEKKLPSNPPATQMSPHPLALP